MKVNIIRNEKGVITGYTTIPFDENKEWIETDTPWTLLGDYQANLIREQIIDFKRQLAKTDYEAIKFSEGELSADDFEPIKIQRRQWREQINKLEAQLNIIVEGNN